MSIAVGLLDQLQILAREHAGDRIEECTVKTGVPEALKTAFEVIAAGTVAEAAKLHIEFVPITARCRRCDRRFEPKIDMFLCPQCGQADVDIIEGDDIVLTSVVCDKEEAAPDED